MVGRKGRVVQAYRGDIKSGKKEGGWYKGGWEGCIRVGTGEEGRGG